MISEYLEDIFAPLGKKAGIAPSDMSLIYTPQIVASLIQVPINWFLTEFGARVVDAVLGIGSALAVATGMVRGKDAAEVSEMASYWLTNIYVPPANSAVVSQQAVSFVSGAMNGNTQGMINAIYQGQNAMNNIIAPTGLVNPASYQTGTLTPLSNPIQTSSTSSNAVKVPATSTSTTTSGVSASSLTDPKPRTSNQRVLSLLA